MDMRAELAAINGFAKTALTEEQVYAFSMKLCDNEVDRDFERFDAEALETLGELFLGRSGLFDHQWSALGQTARIYRTEVVEEPGRVTAAGDQYRWLKAWAYLMRTEKHEDLIAEIEGGIKKEVSVGCSVARHVCSICGAEAGTCAHVKGRLYGEALCFTELREPTDAYEWSFVAVPAQRAAGVVKYYEGGRAMDYEKCLEAAGAEGLRLTGEQTRELAGQIKAWKEEARWGRSYREKLRGQVLKCSALLQPDLPRAVMESALQGLTVEELSTMAETYEKMAGRKFPLRPQLAGEPAPGEAGENGAFQI